jgi:predicted nucleic acid-binding protein
VTAYLIDTDICSAHLRSAGGATARFLQHTGQLHISVLTLGELLSWTLRIKSVPKYQQALWKLLADVTVLDVDQAVAEKFGEIRARLLDQGTPVPSIDLMIGATALVRGLVMVTHNVQHFARIPDMVVEDWLAP